MNRTISTLNPFEGLTVFARVVEAGSFTRAALQLQMNKSSVSESVRRLEERLGVRLLERTTRRLATTEAGRAFYEHARRALDEAIAGETRAQTLQSRPVGRLRVAAPEVFSRLHLAPLLPQLLDANPELQVELVEGVQAVDLVEAGVDLAIRVAEAPAENLIVRRVGTSRVVIVCSPDYAARKGTPERPEHIVDHRIVGFTPLFWSREWRFEGPEGQVAIPVRPSILTNAGETLRSSALAGAGLTALPTWMVAADIQSGRLVRVLEDWRTPESGIYAVYPSNRLLGAKVKLFVDHVARRLRQVGLDAA